MSHHESDMSQIKTMIEVMELEKEKIKNQILQLNQAVAKKQVSIDKFKDYIDTYSKALDSVESQNIQIINNNYSFCQHLMRILRSESDEKHQLEQIKQNLLVKYNEHAKKVDGLDAMYEMMKKEKALILEQREEHELSELAVLGACFFRDEH